ncbi:MAG: helix-turn-helix transcriptional regulator [Candidatus Dormibacter sp.]
MSATVPEAPLSAEDVKRMRGDLGLSQRQLAQQLGVTAGYIALLESGKRVASARMARRLVQLLESRLVTAGTSPGSGGEAPDPWITGDEASTVHDSPFVVIVGPQNRGRSTFIQGWLGDLRDATSSLLIQFDLDSTGDEDPVSLFQALREQLARDVPRLAPVFQLELQPSASEFVNILERPSVPSLILAFDNWNPRRGGSHRTVADLGMLARRVRIVAATRFAPPIVPGVVVVSVPEPTATAEPSADSSASAIETPSLGDIDQAVRDRRGKLPKSWVRLVEGLDQPSLRQHPAVWIGLARTLTGRATTRDLERARVEIDNILQVDLGEGLRWHALLCAADLAIVEHEYHRADDFIAELTGLERKSAGAFDLGPVLVMKARAMWEQSRFGEALEALEAAEPRLDEDICRVANWKARTQLALGMVAPALRSAELGARVAEDAGIRGGLAYSLALAAQIEVTRGNLRNARRLLARASSASDEALEMRVKPQILMQLAELETFDGTAPDAEARIQEAAVALASRPRRIWDSAYLTLVRSRITRRRMNVDLILSMAHALTFEAGVVSARAPRHPVIAALHTEAAAAWVAAGYSHQAGISMGKVDESRADWLTRLELAQVHLFLTAVQPQPYLLQARALVERVANDGAPYLAGLTAYHLAARVQSQWHEVSESLGKWTLAVANARGWKRLARDARLLVPATPTGEHDRGQLITNPDGSRTLVAPYRGQQPARAEIRPPLPDPFEEGPN